MTKKCKKCEKVKELNADNFYRKTTTKDGFSDKCKECVIERVKERQKEKTNEYSLFF